MTALGPKARALLDATQHIDDPGPADRERVRARLERALLASGVAAAGVGAATRAAAASSNAAGGASGTTATAGAGLAAKLTAALVIALGVVGAGGALIVAQLERGQVAAPQAVDRQHAQPAAQGGGVQAARQPGGTEARLAAAPAASGGSVRPQARVPVDSNAQPAAAKGGAAESDGAALAANSGKSRPRSGASERSERPAAPARSDPQLMAAATRPRAGRAFAPAHPIAAQSAVKMTPSAVPPPDSTASSRSQPKPNATTGASTPSSNAAQTGSGPNAPAGAGLTSSPPSTNTASNAPAPNAPAAVLAAPVEVAPTRPPTRAAAGNLQAELALLGRAQRALAANSFSAALAALDEHASRFPHGSLVPERLATRAVALCRDHQASSAKRALSELEARAPSSPLLSWARTACAQR